MHAVLMLCFVAVAHAQYDYTPGLPLAAASDGTLIGGAAQLSEPIQPLANEYNKVFYSYSAPEQEFENHAAHEQMLNSLKKNLRVLFIKGPDNTGLEQAALQLASASADDRTAIYVLSKQSDVSDLGNKLNQIKQQSHNKPEVHFVKYRTQSDADNAQRTIQAQYNSLPGPSTNHNAGTPSQVLDFVSHDTPAVPASASVAATTGQVQVPSNNVYLPPSRRFAA